MRGSRSQSKRSRKPVRVFWPDWVNEGEPAEHLRAVRRSVLKGQPYGSEPWVERMVRQWNLAATLRDRGRPKREFVNNGS